MSYKRNACWLTVLWKKEINDAAAVTTGTGLAGDNSDWIKTGMSELVSWNL